MGPALQASAPTGATCTAGSIGMPWIAGAARADTTPMASTQCLAAADLVRRQRAPTSARSRIADTLRVNAASRLVTVPPAPRLHRSRPARCRVARPRIDRHSVAPLARRKRSVRSGRGPARSDASPRLRATRPRPARRTRRKNVSTRCRNADRRAARRGVTGRYTYRNPSSPWRTCPFFLRMRSCVRTVDDLGSPGSSSRTTLAGARPCLKRMSMICRSRRDSRLCHGASMPMRFRRLSGPPRRPSAAP